MRAAERVEPVDGVAGAVAVFTPSLPDVWELNALLAPAEAGRDVIAQLLEAAERVQGATGLRHRKLRLGGPGPAASDLEAPASARGWTVDRELVMIRRRAPDREPGPGAPVRELTKEEIEPAEDRFLASEPHGRDPMVRRQLVAQSERWEAAATAARRVGIVEDGGVVAWCRLYDDDDGVTEIDGVGVLSERRGSGLGRSLLEGVLACVPEDRVLFLLADADDWPRQLYGRLGFDVVGERLGATKPPAGPAA